MTAKPPPSVWVAGITAILGLLALYWTPLATGFLNDDYFFLEAAEGSLANALSGLGPLGNYFRPLSRQIYFALLTPIAGGHPLVFHTVNFSILLAALWLLADLLRVFLPRTGVMAGLAFFAFLPFQRVNMIWVSCAQDLLALALVLGALALHRRGRILPAAFLGVAAMASKESAWPFPAALLAWDVLVESRPWSSALRRIAPAAVLAAAWLALATWMRMQHAVEGDFVRFAPQQFLAGYVHMMQALLGLDHPQGFVAGLTAVGPNVVALALAAGLAWWVVRPPRTEEPVVRRLPGFALCWLLLFGLVTGPAAHTWSSYYYTVAAVGGAMLVGWTARRMGRAGWLALVAVLAWWHAGSNAVQAFAVENRPWGWTSQLTSFYFERAAGLTTTLSKQMRELEPTPPADTRFFFALLPSWAGFQMGNGALIRKLYRDPSLESHFYSDYSEATSGSYANRFLYWNGARLEPLYQPNQSPFFRVGCDLLLLDRPAGAAHAFHRGLDSGENPVDIQYWLGWAELWRGDRPAAEQAWKAFGALDDSLRWLAGVHAARAAMFQSNDSLAARRHLLESIRYGIGRPEGHAALGQLLNARGSRFGVLELKVAAALDPRDWRSRRDLFAGLVDARLDEPAERVFAELRDVYPEWRSDSIAARAAALLEARSVGANVASFAEEIP